MKKVLGVIIVTLTIATLLKIDIKKNSVSGLLLSNIEALAADEGVQDCDILVYNRNQVEDSQIEHVQTDIDGGFYITVNGKKISLGVGVSAGGSVKVYVCSDKDDNCCAKSWVEKSVEYL